MGNRELDILLSLAKRMAIREKVIYYIKKYSCGKYDLTRVSKCENKEELIYEISTEGKTRKLI